MLFTKDIGLASPKYKEHRTTKTEASEDEQLASGIFSNDHHKPLKFPPSVYGAMILTDKLQQALDPSGSAAPLCNTCVCTGGPKNSIAKTTWKSKVNPVVFTVCVSI